MKQHTETPLIGRVIWWLLIIGAIMLLIATVPGLGGW